MSLPQSNPHSDPFEALVREMSATVDQSIGRAPRPAVQPAPGGMSKAPPGGEMWGPSTQRATSPLQLLVQAADNAHWLQDQVAALVADITGEEPPVPRQRTVPKSGGGLLPAIGHFAHEIETCQREIARQIKHLGGKLP